MRLLLDTHVLLWWMNDDKRLSTEAREEIATAEDARVSVISVWEIAIKRALGRLEAPDHLAEHIARAGFRALPITFEHAEVAGALPRHHDDPFDRMLVAQTRVDGLTLVTADRRLPDYGIPVLVTG